MNWPEAVGWWFAGFGMGISVMHFFFVRPILRHWNDTLVALRKTLVAWRADRERMGLSVDDDEPTPT